MTTDNRSTDGAPPAVDWKRNLVGLWIAQFTAMFGFSFALPFLPLYLHSELHVRGVASLSSWTGLVAGAGGASMMVASPVWGWFADRRGRRPMLVRSILGGAVSVGLMGLAQTPGQLVGLRLLQGATAGTMAAGAALVAAETPRTKVAWSLGVMSSAVALGSATAPLAGSLAVLLVGMRWLFFAAAVLLVASALPVFWLVRESRSQSEAAAAPAPPAGLQVAGMGARAVLAALIGSQALMMFAYASTQQMAVLRILQLAPASATVGTGAAFGVAGAATALASVFYGRVAARVGQRWFAVAAALLFGGAIAACALAPSLALLVASVGLFGLFYGCLNPALYSMIGLETPLSVQSTVYGLSASAVALGVAVGPALTGFLAALTNLQLALGFSAATAIVAAAVVAAGGREPRAAVLSAEVQPAR